jgi:hypothetical protein
MQSVNETRRRDEQSEGKRQMSRLLQPSEMA